MTESFKTSCVSTFFAISTASFRMVCLIVCSCSPNGFQSSEFRQSVLNLVAVYTVAALVRARPEHTQCVRAISLPKRTRRYGRLVGSSSTQQIDSTGLVKSSVIGIGTHLGA